MNGKKETILMFVFVAAFLITVFFMCAGRSTVHDLRERAAPVRSELSDAREAQQREAETIGRAGEAARKIRIKTRQRNMWILISAGLGYLAAR